MEASGGVNYYHLGLPVFCCLNGIINHRTRVSARLMGYNLYANPFTPSHKLVGSCSPEGVGGCQNNLFTITFKSISEFGYACGLTGTIYPHHQNSVQAN